jgi:hypothetical protein
MHHAHTVACVSAALLRLVHHNVLTYLDERVEMQYQQDYGR